MEFGIKQNMVFSKYGMERRKLWGALYISGSIPFV
jgi:hypothetical protein